MSPFLYFCLYLIVFKCAVKSASDTNVRDLLKELFTTRSYNKLVRPIVNQSEPVIAYVEYFLYGVNKVNEVEQKLTTTGFLELYWQDEFLSWDPSSYGDLEYLFLPQEYIWKPDVSLQNDSKI